jgi:predicted nucleic acid-binding protein
MILLDTNILGYLCHSSKDEKFSEPKSWLSDLLSRSVELAIPEIADYELRRSLLRINSARSLMILERLETDLIYLPLSTSVMRQAAEIWADTRRMGHVTAPDGALDGDVILAAQALEIKKLGRPVIVATTNVRHLNWFVDARRWDTIAAGSEELMAHILHF